MPDFVKNGLEIPNLKSQTNFKPQFQITKTPSPHPSPLGGEGEGEGDFLNLEPAIPGCWKSGQELFEIWCLFLHSSITHIGLSKGSDRFMTPRAIF